MNAISIPADDDALRLEIKRVIIEACERDVAPETIDNHAVLVGAESVLDLDSLDALQAAVAVSKRFGVRIRDGNHARRVMASINSLAEFIRQQDG